MTFVVTPIKLTSPGKPHPKRDITLAIQLDEPPEAERVPFLECTTGQCRWPYDEGALVSVCAQPTVSGTSWCAHHLRRAMPPVAADMLIRGRLARKANGYAANDKPQDETADEGDGAPPDLTGYVG